MTIIYTTDWMTTERKLYRRRKYLKINERRKISMSYNLLADQSRGDTHVDNNDLMVIIMITIIMRVVVAAER